MPRASKSKTGAAPASKPRTGAIEFDPRPDLSLLEAYEQKNVRLWREAADNPTVIPNYSFKDERAWAEMNGAPEPGDPSRRGGETIELDGVSPTVLCGSDGSYGGVVIPGFLTGDALAHFTHATERVMEMELPPKLRSKPLAARAHFIRRSQASKALQRRISDLTASAQLRESGVIDGRLGTATSVPEFPTGPEPLASPPQNALPTPNPCPAPAARTVRRSARVRQSKTTRTPRQSPPTTILRPRPTPKNLARPKAPLPTKLFGRRLNGSHSDKQRNCQDVYNRAFGIYGDKHYAFWHPTGHDQSDVFQASRDLRVHGSAAQLDARMVFLDSNRGLDYRVDHFVKLGNPAWYDLLSAARPLVMSRPTAAAFERVWNTNFLGRAVIMNRQSGEHLDVNGVPRGWDVIIAGGEYTGGGFHFRDMNLRTPFPPGTLVAFDGTAQRHAVEEFHGRQRISHVYFAHQSVFEELGLDTTLPDLMLEDLRERVGGRPRGGKSSQLVRLGKRKRKGGNAGRRFRERPSA